MSLNTYLQEPPQKRKCDYCGRVRKLICEDTEIYGRKFNFCDASICLDGFIYNAIGRGIIIVDDNMGFGKDPMRRVKYEEHRRREQETLKKYVENFKR